MSAIFAASFAEQIVFGGATAKEFVVPAAAIALGTSAVLIAPLLFFLERLIEVKQRGLLEYGTLGAHYPHVRRQMDSWRPDE